MTETGEKPGYSVHRKEFLDSFMLDFLKVYAMKMLVADDQPGLQQ